MARIALGAKLACVLLCKRHAAQNGDAVIALLPVDRDMLESELSDRLMRKRRVGDLRFLQAQHVDVLIPCQLAHDRHAQAHGVDVPRRDSKGGHGAYRSACSKGSGATRNEKTPGCASSRGSKRAFTRHASGGDILTLRWLKTGPASGGGNAKPASNQPSATHYMRRCHSEQLFFWLLHNVNDYGLSDTSFLQVVGNRQRASATTLWVTQDPSPLSRNTAARS